MVTYHNVYHCGPNNATAPVNITTNDRYLYITCWGDDGSAQGLLHDLNVDGVDVFSGSPYWTVAPGDSDVDVCFPSQILPAADAIAIGNSMEARIPGLTSGASWVAPAVGCANSGIPTTRCYVVLNGEPSISTNARWTWFESGNCPSPDSPFRFGCNHREFLIFRLDMATVSDSARTCVTPPKDMIGWWPIDEQVPPIARDIAGVNDCVHVGAPALVNGFVERSRNFNSSSTYLENTSPSSQLQLATGDFSIDAWIRTADTTATERTIVSKRVSHFVCNTGYRFFLSAGGRLAFQALNLAPFVASAPVLRDGLWHHVAVTVVRNNASGGRLYVDGVDVLAFSTIGLGNTTDPGPFRIGMDGPCGVQEPFRGDIDEVEVFDRWKSGGEISAIYQARKCGKCKKACYLTWDVSTWQGQATRTVNLVICNYSLNTEFCQWSISGLPVGSECSAVGPTTFSPSGGITPPVVPGAPCVSIPITITVPPLTGTQIACYRATVTNPVTGETFSCEGSIQNNPTVWCARRIVDYVELAFGDSAVVDFELTNPSGSPVTIDYVLEGAPGDMVGEEQAMRLNGLPPGTPVTGSISVAAQSSVLVPVTCDFERHDPFVVHDIIFSTDLDGDGDTEALEATLVRSVLQSPVDVTAPPPSEATWVTVAPSPFTDGTIVRFSLGSAQRAEVRIIDVSGRVVRTLHSGEMSAGAHTLAWDGRDLRGRESGSGIYFVRVETAHGAETAKVVRLR